MARRGNNNQSQQRLFIKKKSHHNSRVIEQTSSSNLSMAQQSSSESLDDETKLAKRHLTKEMWQLVSIAVKRMADELVSISNNQQSTTRTPISESQITNTFNSQQTGPLETNNIHQQPSSTQQPITLNPGAGDVPCVKEKKVIIKESNKRRTLPIDMLEPCLQFKKKEISNNATRRTNKSKVQNKSSIKKTGKLTVSRSRHNRKLK